MERRNFTYKVEHQGQLTTKNWGREKNGKTYTQKEVEDAIHQGINRAFAYKCGCAFEKRASGRTDFTFVIRRDKGTHAGTHYHNNLMVLDVLNNDRGWSIKGIQNVATHEMGHSFYFFGSGHTNGSYNKDGRTYNYMMHYTASRLHITFTSPAEARELQRKYGVDTELDSLIAQAYEGLKPYGRKVRPLRDELFALRKERAEIIEKMNGLERGPERHALAKRRREINERLKILFPEFKEARIERLNYIKTVIEPLEYEKEIQ